MTGPRRTAKLLSACDSGRTVEVLDRPGHRHDACLWLETAPLAEASVDPSLVRPRWKLPDSWTTSWSPTLIRRSGTTPRASPSTASSETRSGLPSYSTASAGSRASVQIWTQPTAFIGRPRFVRREHGQAGRAATLHLLAGVARDQGSYDESERLFTDAIRLARSSFPGLVRHSLHSLGDLALDRGDYRGAVAYYQASLEITGTSERRSRILCAAGIASALAGLGAYPLATRIWGAVEAEERALGFRMLGDERKRYAQWANTLRGHLGDAAFVAACAEGETLTIDEALSQAMRHTGTIPIRRRRVDGTFVEAPITANDDARFEREGEYWTITYATPSSAGFAIARGSARSRTCLRTPGVRTRLWISNASVHQVTSRRPMRSRRAMRGSCSMRRHAGHTAPG